MAGDGALGSEVGGQGAQAAAAPSTHPLPTFSSLPNSHVSRHVHTCGLPAFGGLPVFLTGISLGGCICLHALLDAPVRPPYIRGVALLAPMLALDGLSKRGINALLAPICAAVSAVAPAAKVARMPRNDLHPDLQALWDSGEGGGGRMEWSVGWRRG